MFVYWLEPVYGDHCTSKKGNRMKEKIKEKHLCPLSCEFNLVKSCKALWEKHSFACAYIIMDILAQLHMHDVF